MSKAFRPTGLCSREETSADSHGQSDGAGWEQALLLSEMLAQQLGTSPFSRHPQTLSDPLVLPLGLPGSVPTMWGQKMDWAD